MLGGTDHADGLALDRALLGEEPFDILAHPQTQRKRFRRVDWKRGGGAAALPRLESLRLGVFNTKLARAPIKSDVLR